jgi:hypothetical protein
MSRSGWDEFTIHQNHRSATLMTAKSGFVKT